jgi:uncharacterized membrane protein
VFWFIFTKVDSIFRFDTPGVGVLVTLLIVLLVGFIASNFLTRGIVNVIDRLFARLPLVKLIYTAIKDLINAFVGDKKGFSKPVLVTLLPGSPVQSIGFVTRESLDVFGIQDRVAVYLPQSYNVAGNLIIVPRELVTPLQVDGGQLMAFIVSGGITAKDAGPAN